MNYKLVTYHIGFLLLLLASAMAVCLGLGYLLPPGAGHSGAKELHGWELSMALTALSGIALIVCGWKRRRTEILRRDAIGIVGVGWFVCSCYGALPYVLCAPRLSIQDAYFESVSGLTTTGATVFGNLSQLPETILLWRSETQWLGGMGILAMFVLVLSSLGASGRSLFQSESSAHMHELREARLRQTVRSLWGLYLVLTVVCAIGLWMLGMTPFQAANHAMTTTSTGGFGTEGTSIDGFGSAIRLWILIFMFTCGIGFPLYLVMLRRGRDWGTLRKHEETWAFCEILLVASAALVIDRAVAGQFDGLIWQEILVTVFNVVSVATTTGYVVGDYDSWPALAKGIILFLMMVGGCAGSTAGGLKVARLILWFKLVRNELRRAFRPNQVMRLRLNGWPVPVGTRGQLFVIVTSATAVVGVGSYLLLGLEPSMTADGCATAVLTCVSNVGPGFNEVGPTQNFSALAPSSKILLAFLMIVGRLEYIAILVLFSRSLWRRF